MERDANAIAQRTRRGKGNIILCSADVASALTMAGVLDYTPALNANLNVDDTGNTFAGTLQGKYRVYIDPYSANLNQVMVHLQVVTSTMLLVIKVLLLMMLDCSTAHTFLYRWFVQLERIHSSQKSALRLVTESLRTHLPKDLIKVLVNSKLTQTATTGVLLLRTLCKRDAYISQETLLREGLFFV